MLSATSYVHWTDTSESAKLPVFIASVYKIYSAISMHIKRCYYLLLPPLSGNVCFTPLYKQVHTCINHCSYHHYCANGLNQSHHLQRFRCLMSPRLLQKTYPPAPILNTLKKYPPRLVLR